MYMLIFATLEINLKHRNLQTHLALAIRAMTPLPVTHAWKMTVREWEWKGQVILWPHYESSFDLEDLLKGSWRPLGSMVTI